MRAEDASGPGSGRPTLAFQPLNRLFTTLFVDRPPYLGQEHDFPPCEGASRSYLIASTPRSGSTLLGNLLYATGRFGVPEEYLHRRQILYWHDRFGERNVDRLLHLIARVRTSPGGWFGLKAHFKDFAHYAARTEAVRIGRFDRVVHIRRRDLLGQAISFARAEQSGRWRSTSPRIRPEFYSYRWVVAKARSITEQTRGWERLLAGVPPERVQTVVYEDLVADREAGMAGLAAFLDGSQPVGAAERPEFRRQSDTESRRWRDRFLSELRPRDRWIVEGDEPRPPGP